MRKVIISGMVGNALEWYDFAIYGQVAGIIGAKFFPQADASAQLLASYGAFAAGFVARPFGGIIFGMIGDSLGRKTSLSLSVILMAAATGAIGIMPEYATAGILAPILLVLVRLLQGLSLGGEFSGAIAYTIEHSPQKHRGLIGSMTIASLIIGFLTGSLMATAFSWLMPPGAFEDWGWRIPFVLGIGIGLIGFYIRRSCEESPVYEAARAEESLSKTPVREVIKHHWRPLIRAIGVYFNVTMPFYMASIYFISYNRQHLGLDTSKSMAINAAGMFAMLLAVPVSAILSDRFGRKKVLMAMGWIFALGAWPLFSLFTSGELVPTIAGELIFSAMVGLMTAPVPAFLAELFPTRIRTTGMAIAYNIAATALGGTAPMVCVWLVEYFGSPSSLAFYVILTGLSAAISLIGYHDRSHEDLA